MSDSDDGDFVPKGAVVIPPAHETPERLKEEIARLQAEIGRLKAETRLGAAVLEQATFQALTGFYNVDAAREQFELAGGSRVFAAVDRHTSHISEDALLEARRILCEQMPGCKRELELAFEHVSNHQKKSSSGHRGNATVVDDFHLFLLVFMYIHGGVLEEWSPFLPGIKVSKSQCSRLLRNTVPVVVQNWVPFYYKPNDLVWLRENACPGVDLPPPCQEGATADFLLLIDGIPLYVEKASDSFMQKALYDWSKDEDHIVRVLLVTTRDGHIFRFSAPSGGRTEEVTVANAMQIPESINSLVETEEKQVHLHIVVDRGFLFYDPTPELPFVVTTLDRPLNLNKVYSRGKWPRGEKKEPKRKQFTADETNYNRSVASVRWVNEWSVGALRRCRLFHKCIDMSIVDELSALLAIGCALVNYNIDIKYL
jgi:hypothetical protein